MACSSRSRIIRCDGSMRSIIITTTITQDGELNAPGGAIQGGSSMRAGKLLLQITAYYLIIG